MDNEYCPSSEESEESAKYCKKAADLGDTDAMAYYANMLRIGDGVDKDIDEALKYVKKSIENEDTASDEGYYVLGMMYLEGEGVEKDVKKAAEYFKMAAKYEKKGMYRYVKLMLDDSIDEVPLDQDEAVYYSRRGAEKGEGHCMYYYGLFLFHGNGAEQDREEAIEWIQKARNKYIVEAD